MFKTLRNAWAIKEIRNKILFTVLILLVFRVGSVIPVPFVSGTLQSVLQESGSLFAYFNILSGEAFSKATLFALSA